MIEDQPQAIVHLSKETEVTRSSTEAELRTIIYGICELLWLKLLLEELQATIKLQSKIYNEIKVIINISRNPIHHDKIKPVEADQHFIKKGLKKE